MRPDTLLEALRRIAAGEPRAKAMGEFLDCFYGARSAQEALDAIRDEPPRSGDPVLDALAAASAEYLAKRYALPAVPDWVCGPGRKLDRPHFTAPFEDAALREYLTHASPAEFRSRNIFTEERPLRRASAARVRFGA